MRIDVFHDTVCPWCRIGKHNMKTALANWKGEVEIYYHTFFLNAGVPPEGYDFQEYMRSKFRIQDLERIFEGPRYAGEQVGLQFNFDAIQRTPNTIMSHRLIAMTPDKKKEAMIDGIYDAYFVEGRDIGSLDVLKAIAAEVGLDAEDIATRLASDEAHQEVLAEAWQAQQFGITGVPFFVFNNMLALSGAHPPQVFTQALQQASDMSKA